VKDKVQCTKIMSEDVQTQPARAREDMPARQGGVCHQTLEDDIRHREGE